MKKSLGDEIMEKFKKGEFPEANGIPPLPQKMNKIGMQSRRVEHDASRASFMTFLMWLCVFVAATIGFRASKVNPEENRWIRCTYWRACIFLVLATIFGIVKLVFDYKMIKGMERLDK